MKSAPLPIRSGIVYIESMGERGMISITARISSIRLHSTNFGDGHGSRRAPLSDREGIGEPRLIPPGGPLTLGKQKPLAL